MLNWLPTFSDPAIYREMGAASIALLILSMALSAYVLLGRPSLRKVYLVAGVVFILMGTITGLCVMIWVEYRP